MLAALFSILNAAKYTNISNIPTLELVNTLLNNILQITIYKTAIRLLNNILHITIYIIAIYYINRISIFMYTLHMNIYAHDHRIHLKYFYTSIQQTCINKLK